MENPEQFFLRLQYELHHLAQVKALEIVKDEAEMFVQQNFLNQSFKDTNVSAWKERKGEKDANGNRIASHGNFGRNILVKTGELRRAAIKSQIQGDYIVFDFPLPYAARHNFGRAGMPQRQFIGDSAYLRARIKQRIQDHLKTKFLL